MGHLPAESMEEGKRMQSPSCSLSLCPHKSAVVLWVYIKNREESTERLIWSPSQVRDVGATHTHTHYTIINTVKMKAVTCAAVGLDHCGHFSLKANCSPKDFQVICVCLHGLTCCYARASFGAINKTSILKLFYFRSRFCQYVLWIFDVQTCYPYTSTLVW